MPKTIRRLPSSPAAIVVIACRLIVDRSSNATGDCANGGAFSASSKTTDGRPCACAARDDAYRGCGRSIVIPPPLVTVPVLLRIAAIPIALIVAPVAPIMAIPNVAIAI